MVAPSHNEQGQSHFTAPQRRTPDDTSWFPSKVHNVGVGWRDPSDGSTRWVVVVLCLVGSAFFGWHGIAGLVTGKLSTKLLSRYGGDLYDTDAVIMSWFLLAVALALLIVAVVNIARTKRRD